MDIVLQRQLLKIGIIYRRRISVVIRQRALKSDTRTWLQRLRRLVSGSDSVGGGPSGPSGAYPPAPSADLHTKDF